ncbi:Kelch repeat-containing protein [Bacillus velezensis]|uniref:Kelch repeat-containing protein n=1 Tax=Bacillus velezensis TaxID=492670 RepID=UPI003464B61A
MKKNWLVVFVILAFAVLVSYVPVQAEQTLSESKSDSKEWVPKANLPESRTSAMTASVNGKIYVFGGTHNGVSTSTTYVYDPESNVWSNKNNMPIAVTSGSAVAVGEKIYIIGGTNAKSGNTKVVYLKTVLVYNTQNDTWEKEPDIPSERPSFTSVAAVGKHIYVMGGAYENLSKIFCYDTESKIWSQKRDLPVPIGGATAQTFNGKIYIIGGANSILMPPKTTYDSIYEYDPETDIWLEKNKLLTGVQYTTSALLDGKIYILGGGSSSKEVTSKVQVYNPKDNSVTELKGFTNKRMAASAASIGSKLYIIGGQSVYDSISRQKTGLLNSVEMFDTSKQTDVNPDKPEDPKSNGDRAILTITMTTGLEKEFDLSMEEVNDFINWYDQKDSGTGPSRYEIDKHNNNIGPFENRKDHVIFKNILTFEVNEYSTNTSNNQSVKTT